MRQRLRVFTDLCHKFRSIWDVNISTLSKADHKDMRKTFTAHVVQFLEYVWNSFHEEKEWTETNIARAHDILFEHCGPILFLEELDELAESPLLEMKDSELDEMLTSASTRIARQHLCTFIGASLDDAQCYDVNNANISHAVQLFDNMLRGWLERNEGCYFQRLSFKQMEGRTVRDIWATQEFELHDMVNGPTFIHMVTLMFDAMRVKLKKLNLKPDIIDPVLDMWLYNVTFTLNLDSPDAVELKDRCTLRLDGFFLVGG